MPEHFDVIIIGTGAGGGRSRTLAPSGAHLLLERGASGRHHRFRSDPESSVLDEHRKTQARQRSQSTRSSSEHRCVNPALTAIRTPRVGGTARPTMTFEEVEGNERAVEF
jgi:choline dehydrogenase-like flavoprotein